jgi:hypothetical protein
MSDNVIEARFGKTFISTCSFLNEKFGTISNNSICQVIECMNNITLFYGSSLRIDFYIKYDNNEQELESYLYYIYRKTIMIRLNNEINNLNDTKLDSISKKCRLSISQYDLEYYESNKYYDDNLFKISRKLKLKDGIIGTIICHDYNIARFFFEKLKGKVKIKGSDYETRVLDISNNFTRNSKIINTKLNIKDYFLNQLTDKIVAYRHINKIIDVPNNNKISSTRYKYTKYIVFHPNTLICDYLDKDDKTINYNNESIIKSIDVENIMDILYNRSFFIISNNEIKIECYNIKNLNVSTKMVVDNNYKVEKHKEENVNVSTKEEDDEMENILPKSQIKNGLNNYYDKIVKDDNKIVKKEKLPKNQKLISVYATENFNMNDQKIEEYNTKKRKNEESVNHVNKRQKTMMDYFLK